MKCQFCNKDKTYDLTEVENNKAKATYALCSECLQHYVKDKNSLTNKPSKLKEMDHEKLDQFVQEMMDFVNKALGDIFGSQNATIKTNKKPCPKCQSSLEDISKNGKFGCPYCYDWYAEELEQTLRVIHAVPDSPENLIHTGKRPKHHPPSVITKSNETDKMRMMKLRYKLSQAIKDEDYESAAKLRDIIKELEELGKV